MPARILVIDDEESMCHFMEIMLVKEGYEVETSLSATDALTQLRSTNYDLVITDLQMPDMTGIDLVREVKGFKAEQEMFVMTAYASVDTAIEAMKEGASDYITKPFKVDEIKLTIAKAINRRGLARENEVLKKQLQDKNSFDAIIGQSTAITQVKRLAERIASSDSTVLIRGESGTGKDLMARAIHHHSPRCGGPFVTLNCAALPETLLESELFGHKRGSFTGANRDKDGLLKAADGGTFFLDEVGNMSPAIQVKLLRVLEDKKVTPVGDTKPFDVDIRLIAATNADLEADVKGGRFRADLFYRLNVLPISLPPLRERLDDIPLLVEFFLDRFAERGHGPRRTVNADVLTLLAGYAWPGNVRELENTLERAIVMNRSDALEPADFPGRLTDQPPALSRSDGEEVEPSATTPTSPSPTLEIMEKAYIQYVLTQTDGKKSEAARILGIDASTLYRKLERYKMSERERPNRSSDK